VETNQDPRLPSRHLFVTNCGSNTQLDAQHLTALFSRYGVLDTHDVRHEGIPPGGITLGVASIAWVSYVDPSAAAAAKAALDVNVDVAATKVTEDFDRDSLYLQALELFRTRRCTVQYAELEAGVKSKASAPVGTGSVNNARDIADQDSDHQLPMSGIDV